MAKPGEIELGDIIQDTLTGFKGVAYGKTDWLHGCTRWTIQPQTMKDGKPLEPMSFDEPQLKILKKKAHASKKDTGGPRPEVHRQSIPKR